MQKRPFLKALGSSVALAALPTLTRAQGQPIRVGSTMSMTGPLAATAIIHKISTEIFIENLNQRGGLLFRMVGLEAVLSERVSHAEGGSRSG